eukprot:866700-Prymnesium_polylepis.1
MCFLQCLYRTRTRNAAVLTQLAEPDQLPLSPLALPLRQGQRHARPPAASAISRARHTLHGHASKQRPQCPADLVGWSRRAVMGAIKVARIGKGASTAQRNLGRAEPFHAREADGRVDERRFFQVPRRPVVSAVERNGRTRAFCSEPVVVDGHRAFGHPFQLQVVRAAKIAIPREGLRRSVHPHGAARARRACRRIRVHSGGDDDSAVDPRRQPWQHGIHGDPCIDADVLEAAGHAPVYRDEARRYARVLIVEAGCRISKGPDTRACVVGGAVARVTMCGAPARTARKWARQPAHAHAAAFQRGETEPPRARERDEDCGRGRRV